MRIALSLVVLLAVLSACPSTSPTNDAGTGGGGSDAGTGGGTGGGGGTDDAGTDAGVPLRILVMFDGAPSLTVTDPNATRIEALRALLLAHANEPRTSVAVMAFSGSTSAWFSSNTAEFVPMTSIASSDRNTMLARLASFAVPGDGGTDVTDFVKPLADAYVALSADISAQQGSTYAVIFLSDGRPSANQDAALLCGDSVIRLRDLRLTGAGDVRFNTVHVYTPLAAPTCTADAGWQDGGPCGVPIVGNPTECPAAEIDADAMRLERMSTLGGGQFRDVRNHDAVDFTGLVP